MAGDCLFCKIVAGEIDADVVERREDVLAFRDIAPAAPAHVLVIPTRHIEDARAVGRQDGDVVASMFEVAREVARTEGLDDGFRLVLNVGPHAGQTVFHLHMHVLGGAPLGPMASG